MATSGLVNSANIPNCSFDIYEGEGGVTLRVDEELRSLDLPLANMVRALGLPGKAGRAIVGDDKDDDQTMRWKLTQRLTRTGCRYRDGGTRRRGKLGRCYVCCLYTKANV